VVDLKQVAELIEALERDLRAVKTPDPHLQKVLDEVETIKNALKSPSPKHPWIRESLGSIEHALEHAAGSVLGEVIKDAQYVAQIGRIIGLG
jgi:hypothetical protein